MHGDAHTGNLLNSRSGLRWIDLEDVCLGPVEWDLAATLGTQLTDTYPGPIDRELLEACRDLRRLQNLAWLLTDDAQDPPLYEQLTSRLRQGAP